MNLEHKHNLTEDPSNEILSISSLGDSSLPSTVFFQKSNQLMSLSLLLWIISLLTPSGNLNIDASTYRQQLVTFMTPLGHFTEYK